MVAVVNVDAYPFVAFSDLTCYHEDKVKIFFLVATKSLLHQYGKNTGVVLQHCHAWKCISAAISGGVDISEVRDEFSVRVTKVTSRMDFSWNHSLPF